MSLFRSGIERICFSPGYGFLPRASTEGDTSTVYFLLAQSRFDVASFSAGFVPIEHRSGSIIICLNSPSFKVLGSKVDTSKGGKGGAGAGPEHDFGVDILMQSKILLQPQKKKRRSACKSRPI